MRLHLYCEQNPTDYEDTAIGGSVSLTQIPLRREIFSTIDSMIMRLPM